MIAEILSTGDEIRSGALVDSNTAYIARELELIGIDVVRHTSVGDDKERLLSVFGEISLRANIAVVTGGLGPTSDDLTTEVAATAAGVGLKLDPEALNTLESFFKFLNMPVSPSNMKQAYLPEGSDCLPNPVGTAAGFMLPIGKCHFFFMPGVPHEMKRMLQDQVIPRIRKLKGEENKIILTRTISLFGIGESTVGETLMGFEPEFPELKLGFRAHFPEIQVKFYAKGDDSEELNRQIEKAVSWVSERLHNHILSLTGDSMEKTVGKLLIERHATIAVAESCTGGLIADKLTNVSGSSDYFLFSGVCYSNEAKIKILGVSPDTIVRYGAVHEETAKEMAEGARRISGATYAISTSGIAGPTGGTPDKPVGTVCIGLAGPNGVDAKRYTFPARERLRNKIGFAMTALNFLRKTILNEKI